LSTEICGSIFRLISNTTDARALNTIQTLRLAQCRNSIQSKQQTQTRIIEHKIKSGKYFFKLLHCTSVIFSCPQSRIWRLKFDFEPRRPFIKQSNAALKTFKDKRRTRVIFCVTRYVQCVLQAPVSVVKF